MRLIAATAFAVMTSLGAAQASSIVVLGGDATTVSSIVTGTAKPSAGSIVQLGTPAIDKGKVASVEAEMGPAPMVIRSGEVGAASAAPIAPAPVAAQASDSATPTAPVQAAK